MYLSSIQQGIQSAHVISDMFMKYVTITEDYEITGDPKRIMLWDWAKNHKTMVLLNGGYGETIRELVQFFDNQENPYPWAEFHEGEDALDGALTDVGIILPEKIYATGSYLRTLRFSDKERALDEIVNTGSLVIPAEVTGGEVTTWDFNKWEYQLIQKLNTFGLAK
jgi:hypothetical protein